MQRPPVPNPYDGFKSDTLRRKALGTMERWRSAAKVAMAFAVITASDAPKAKAVVAWLARALG